MPGRTENIRVRSIIARFLEHSRIFHFAAAVNEPLHGEFYIGSADWMYRNLSKRVELVTPVVDPDGKARLSEALDIALNDRRSAWVLNENATYSQLHPLDGEDTRGSHQQLMDLARRRAE